MAFVPVIVPNKRKNSYRTRSGSSAADIAVALVVLGLMFLFMFGIFDLNRFSFTPFSFIFGFIIFIIIVVGISAISISMSETYKKPKINSWGSYDSHYRNQSKIQKRQYNPYIIRKSIRNETGKQNQNQIKQKIPTISEINYCRFCGAKVDRDAVFCHQCGINISS